jgi:hypothetical protein
LQAEANPRGEPTIAAMARVYTLCCACVAAIALLGWSADAHAARKPSVLGELRRMLDASAIDEAAYDERRSVYLDAKATARRLTGARRVELSAVVRNLEAIAARRDLTSSRLGPLWLTLQRNRQWWTTGPLLPAGRRVSFKGSELVWQYYPGEGLQIQPLANFGKLNGLWQGKVYDDRLRALLDELLPLAVERGGGLAWEYYFDFNGGKPPWVSGLAQGTALQALGRAATRLGRETDVLPIARRAMHVFEVPPPVGVRARKGAGAHYLIYSFNRRLRVLNGFLQALVGLYDFGVYAQDERARELFAEGDVVARREVPAHDTGAWSLYSRVALTRESDLGYHKLVRDFLGSLCQRTSTDVYCQARDRFTGYLTEKPELAVRRVKLRAGRTGRLRFTLSKIARVSVRVIKDGRVVYAGAPTLMGHGSKDVTWRPPRRSGSYGVQVSAVDLAGNVGSASGIVEVARPRRERT